MNPSNPYICVKNKVRGRAGVARQAHNLEVAGSNPVPATIFLFPYIYTNTNTNDRTILYNIRTVPRII